MSFQRPQRPATKGSTREGGLFSLVDNLGKRPASKQDRTKPLRGASRGNQGTFPPPLGQASRPFVLGNSSWHSSNLNDAGGARLNTPQTHNGSQERTQLPPPRPTKPSTPNVMPPLGNSRRLSTPSSTTRTPQSSVFGQPALSRPSTNQGSRLPTPSQGSRRPVSTGGAQDFHRGLVSALHDVLKRQRNGVFPQTSLEGEVQQEMEQSNKHSRPASGTMDTEAMVRMKKAEWAQNQWQQIKRKERHAAEHASQKPTHSRYSPLGFDEHADDLFLDPDAIAAIMDLEKRELKARSLILVAAEKQRGDLMQALKAFDQGFEQRSADSLKKDGNKMYESGDFHGAHRCYSQAIEADPTNPLLLTNRAAAALMMMNYDSCVKDCLQAAEMDPDLERAFSRMAHAYLLLGQYRQAVRHYTTAVTLAGKQPNATRLEEELTAVRSVEKARKLMEANAAAEALEVLQSLRVFNNDPPITYMRLQAQIMVDPSIARTQLSSFLGTLEHPACSDDSTIVIKAASTAFYCDVLVLIAKASFYCGQHYFHIAGSYLRQCLAIRSECRPALLLQKTLAVLEQKLTEINALVDAGKLNEAHAAIGGALTMDPANKKIRAMLFYNRAEISAKMVSSTAAIVDFTNALECDPHHVKALNQRAKAFAAIGDYKQALQDMQRAVELNPALQDDLDGLKREHEQEEQSTKETNQHTHRAQSGHQQHRQSSHQQRRPSTGHAYNRCHYEVLQLPRFSSTDQVKQQYRKLTLKFHPDKVVSQPQHVRDNCMQRFKEISHAYSVLSDHNAKTTYDIAINKGVVPTS